MLRHKMKAGMTGYAQIRGWRGNTSLHKRIRHDMYYIRNWSLGLDIRILLKTLGSVWFSRHEQAPAPRQTRPEANGTLSSPASTSDC
jgi:lipopolysaccharide/colanic/teichoic acid biosynthesis glycosyltransferase